MKDELSSSERFLMAIAYVEALVKQDIPQADLVKKSMSDHDFAAGMTMVASTIYTMYKAKNDEGTDLFEFLRHLGNTMKSAELDEN
jgi:hypothetical protein